MTRRLNRRPSVAMRQGLLGLTLGLPLVAIPLESTCPCSGVGAIAAGRGGSQGAHLRGAG